MSENQAVSETAHRRLGGDELHAAFPVDGTRLNIVSVPSLGLQLRGATNEYVPVVQEVRDINAVLGLISSRGWDFKRPTAVQKLVETGLGGSVEVDLPEGVSLLDFLKPEIEHEITEALAKESDKAIRMSEYVLEHTLFAMLMNRRPEGGEPFHVVGRIMAFEALRSDPYSVGIEPVVESTSGELGLMPQYSMIYRAYAQVTSAILLTEFHTAPPTLS